MKVFVLGLDGATWDILSPLIEAGELPIGNHDFSRTFHRTDECNRAQSGAGNISRQVERSANWRPYRRKQ